MDRSVIGGLLKPPKPSKVLLQSGSEDEMGDNPQTSGSTPVNDDGLCMSLVWKELPSVVLFLRPCLLGRPGHETRDKEDEHVTRAARTGLNKHDPSTKPQTTISKHHRGSPGAQETARRQPGGTKKVPRRHPEAPSRSSVCRAQERPDPNQEPCLPTKFEGRSGRESHLSPLGP